MHLKKALWGILLVPFVLAALWLCRLYRSVDVHIEVSSPEPLRILVTDPLCSRLAPERLENSAKRDYGPLGVLLEERLARPVEILYSDDPDETAQSSRGRIDLIIGRTTPMPCQATATNADLRPIARLTDADGSTSVFGLFITRTKSPAKAIGDLADHRIQFGPPCEVERHSAALATLAEHGVTPVPPLHIVRDYTEALTAVAKGDADVAVVSNYALSLLDGLPGVDKGTLRMVGRTAPQPFITVFAARRLGPATEQAIRDTLLSAHTHPQVLASLKSKAGFAGLNDRPAREPIPLSAEPSFEWTDWRGPDRNGLSPDVPTELPAGPRLLWKRGLTGPGLAGIAATAAHVIVADKSEQNDQDIWRCLDAADGQELWTIAYPTPGQMEFTNTPRATPVIHGSFVYLLSAFGDLHCVEIQGSRIAWRRNIVKEFNAKLPNWGMCSTPLVVDDLLIVNPGAPDASIVALGLYTGETAWQTPGDPPGYGSLILGTFRGVRQIVGHDATSLAGWDPNTGRRLWTLLPTKKGDFNVPTPVNINGRLLVATENNGARLYGFDERGRINPVPIAQNHKLAPDTSTPVAIDGLIFGCFRGLFCLDFDDNLNTLYSTDGEGVFNDYVALVAGNGHVLAVTVKGELILLKAAREAFTPVSRLRLFEDTEVWSHPALIGHRLYIRSMKEICCFLLDD